jgi:hypothetical protein
LVLTNLLSTTSGTWAMLKVRTDNDPFLPARIESLRRGTADDPDRAIRAIASRMSSTNTMLVE